MKGVFLVVFFVIMLGIPVYSLTASVSNPKMVLYKNMSKELLIFENSIIVNNENNYDVEITIIPAGDWKDRVKVKEDKFVLKEGERKEVFYTVTIDEAKSYKGDIIASFKEIGSENKNALALAQTLVVHVEDNLKEDDDSKEDEAKDSFDEDIKWDDEKQENREEIKLNMPVKIFGFLLLAVVLIGVIYFFAKRRNKL